MFFSCFVCGTSITIFNFSCLNLLISAQESGISKGSISQSNVGFIKRLKLDLWIPMHEMVWQRRPVKRP